MPKGNNSVPGYSDCRAYIFGPVLGKGGIIINLGELEFNFQYPDGD
jgi:hypothetical protein